MNKIITIAAVAVAALSLTAGGAVAGSQIGSSDIRDGAVHQVDLSPTLQNKVNRVGTQGPAGPAGAQGPAGAAGAKGDTGNDGLLGAFYATANYNAGDTNSGAIATVACDATATGFTAIAGGAQTLGLGGQPAAVASSFPGRMNWDTNSPRPNRLDGWIVQFDAAQAPEKAVVWALCVPKTNIPVVETFNQTD